MSTTKYIRALEKKRSLLINELLTTNQMIRGSFGITYRRCGKQTCWCIHEKGHSYTRITWTENAQAHTKAIPHNDIPWFKDITKKYRTFRKLRTRISLLDLHIKNKIDSFENEVVEKTNNLKQR